MGVICVYTNAATTTATTTTTAAPSSGSYTAQVTLEGEHFIMVEGLTLEVLKSELTGSDPVSRPNRTPRVKALTRAGVALVLLKTRKPLGVALRHAIADSHFMHELLEGNPEPMCQAVTGQQGQIDMQELATAISTAVVAGVGAILKDFIPQRSEPSPRPLAGCHEDDCIFMASRIADILRREFPGRGIMTRNDVHRFARKCGIRGRDGRSVPGYSRVSSINNGYGYIVKYSTAALDAMREILSQQAEMPF